MTGLLKRQTEHESTWDQEDRGLKKKEENERKERNQNVVRHFGAIKRKKYLHDSTDEKIKENNVLHRNNVNHINDSDVNIDY